ncbi:hypothetical protein JCM10908_007246 [Rhodotorula pacifica]|uniref:E3 ubiquitin-protein ligase BRE1 n=1 Tax=Rhodotorula pacifica TaxID=1495444 RepID=UPI00317743D9
MATSSSSASHDPSSSSKKRVPLTESLAPPTKKARIADEPPTSRTIESRDAQADVDEDEEDEDAQDPKLEAFRKEAIYREMLSYKRQLSRAQAETDKLRSQRTAYQVRISRVEQEWSALVAEANARLPSTSTSVKTEEEDDGADPLDMNVDALLAMGDEELDEALAHRSTATKSLLERIRSLAPSSSSAPSELEQRCAELVAQSLASREHLRILRAEHVETLERLEEMHARLVKAERKFDRMQSRTVADLEGRADPTAAAAAARGDEGTGADRRGSGTPLLGEGGRGSPLIANGSASASSSSVDQPPGALPSSSAGADADEVAAKAREEVELLRDLVARRADELEELRSDRIALKNEIDQLKVKLVDLPDDVVSEQALFKTMQQHVQFLGNEYDSKRVEAEKATKEADELREGMESFREALLRDASTQSSELQSRLTVRESEVARIRSNRDELKAEISELKAKDSDKMNALSEMRTLADARKSRLQAYASELRRLRIGQAGERGDLEGVQLRVRHAEAAAAADDEMEEGEVEIGEDEVAKDLQKRLTKAEELLRALGEQLRAYASSSSSSSSSGGVSGPSTQALIESETRARSDLVEARHRVEKLEAILGPGGRADVREMAERLEEKARELKAAEAKAASQEATATMLYGEIERLSEAWQALDEQNASKVFNLAAMEEKLQRLSAEKAKADNRYFTTMRQKDALMNENSVLNKLVEKQQQKVEAANELQQSLTQQLTSIEKEISLHQANVRAYQETISSLQRENGEHASRNDQSQRRIAELESVLKDRVSEAETEAAARKRADEQLDQIRRKVELLQTQAAATASTSAAASDPAEVRELKKYNDDLLRMLRCSTCNTRWRSCVITRCGHTFCRECVDARLSSRARRCGTCGSSFAASDVGALYF